MLDRFTDKMIALEARVVALETLNAEAMAKMKADQEEAAKKAAIDAKQAEIDALSQEPAPAPTPEEVAANERKARVDKLKAELDAMQAPPQSGSKAA